MTPRGACIGITLILASATARAQSGPWAMPGLARVGAASTGEAPVTMAASAGYGYLGDVLDDGGAHHRAQAGLAASWRALEWLALSARLDGRYDRHSGDLYGDDGSGVLEPRLVARAVTALRADLHLGGELGVWFPGEDGPEAKAISPRALGLVTFQRDRLTVHGNAGFHLDRSGRSVESPEQLLPWDRASLDVSDSPAMLLGAGAELGVGRGSLWAESSWDLLVGGDAPSVRRSPLYAGAGYRHPLARAVDLYAFVDVNVAERDLAGMGSLVPLGSRVSATVAIAYRLEPAPPAASRPAATTVEAASPPPPPATAHLSGRLVGPNGPIAGAQVRAGGQRTTTDADGRFTLEGIPPGPVTIVVEKGGFRRLEKAVSLTPGQHLAVDLSGEPTLPEGQIRGTVLGFDGKPLAARVSIDPGGIVVTADAQGTFQVDVPPGEYQVVVEMPRFQTTRRRVRVEQRGVTLLPIDLKRK